MFCAVCLRELRDAYTREPIGRDDAPVVVCVSCATTPVPDVPPSRRPDRREPTTDRAAAIREHRDRLIARGVCVNGEQHGPAVNGRRVCRRCAERQQSRGRR